jgi:hypothetical protein
MSPVAKDLADVPSWALSIVMVFDPEVRAVTLTISLFPEVSTSVAMK